MLKLISRILCVCAAAGMLALNFIPQAEQTIGLPSKLYVQTGTTSVLHAGLPVMARVGISDESGLEINGAAAQNGQWIDLSKPISFSADEECEINITFSVAGVLTLREMLVKVEDAKKIVPGGHCVGVTLYTKGALVVSTDEILTESGQKANPAKDANILPGDVILSLEGTTVQNADHLSKLVNDLKSNVKVEVLRDGKLFQTCIQPVKDGTDGKLRLGLWVRDSTAGVGTLTYYDPSNHTFGSLGHSITDVDTQSSLIVKEGKLIPANVVGVKKGEVGNPGELLGSFYTGSDAIGELKKNTDFGIFGTMHAEIVHSLYPEGLEIGYQDSIEIGPATLLTTVDGTNVEEFQCEITRITKQKMASTKGLVLTVTDKRLLDKTGGIVQGMSGSPIIQNGKIIGAVTHVFINDPHKGYGVFLEWMLQESNTIIN